MAVPRSMSEVLPPVPLGAPLRVRPEVAAVSLIRPEAPRVVTPEIAPALVRLKAEELMVSAVLALPMLRVLPEEPVLILVVPAELLFRLTVPVTVRPPVPCNRPVPLFTPTPVIRPALVTLKLVELIRSVAKVPVKVSPLVAVPLVFSRFNRLVV